jgi:GTP-binding protein
LPHTLFPVVSNVSDSLSFRAAVYSTSASNLEQCPPDNGQEVAFVGRSNAGKSSAINVLTGQTKLARTSKTPGRTQLLNFFSLGEGRFLVDLPGFGYAKVPLEIRDRWQKQLARYLRERNSLKGLILLMDIRHPFKDSDAMMIQWCLEAELPLHILLTKADKLKRGAARATLLESRKHLEELGGQVTAQLFSSLSGEGVDELRAQVGKWLGDTSQKSTQENGEEVENDGA